MCRKSSTEKVKRSGLGMHDKSKWDKIPSLSIIKLMLFVPKVAAVTTNMSASEQNFPGKGLPDRSTEPWGYTSKELHPN